MEYTLAEIISLHKKYAPSDQVYDLVFVHCQIVYEIACQLIEKSTLPLDHELIRVGSLLHDIGIYPLVGADGELREGVHYITHGVEGEKILKAEGLPEPIWRIASHHTGVGISEEDITSMNLPMPLAEYQAESDEEQLIMYADKFHSKSNPSHFNSFEWYARDVAKFGDHKVEKFNQMALKFGLPDLQPLVNKYSFGLRS